MHPALLLDLDPTVQGFELETIVQQRLLLLEKIEDFLGGLSIAVYPFLNRPGLNIENAAQARRVPVWKDGLRFIAYRVKLNALF